MKPAFFLLLSSASASSLNPERKKGKIQYLSELLLDQIRAENIDDYITEEKIENTVAKLVSGLDTVNYSACSSEFDTEVLNGEFEYTAPEDKTVLCDLAERVPMKVRSWVRHFGCREAFEKKYFKKMRKQAARLKNLAEGVGRCNCIDPCLSLDAGSCWTIMDSCEESLYSPLNWERLTIEPVLKINLEFECQDPLGFALDGTIFKATTRKQLEKRLLLEVEYQTRDGETKVHVTNENFNYSFTCSPGDWHCIELEHIEKTGWRGDFSVREEWLKIDGVIKRANIESLDIFQDSFNSQHAISYVGNSVKVDYLPYIMNNKVRNVFVHTFDNTV